MDCSIPGLPVPHHLPKFIQVHVHCTVMPSSHLILWRPLLLLPSIFPSIRDFSNVSVVCIRWPKYWNFSFSISPYNEHSGLISLKTDWFDLPAIHGTLKSLLQHYSLKASILCCSAFFTILLLQTSVTTGKTIPWRYGPLSAELCLCFSTHCLGLSWLSCQEAIVFWFHGCGHHLQWF